jgi:hypothetical protein
LVSRDFFSHALFSLFFQIAIFTRAKRLFVLGCFDEYSISCCG